MNELAVLADVWQFVTGALVIVLSAVASVHVVLHKRDTRAAISWIGLLWLAPVIGPTVYLVFGINRIRRRVALRRAFRAPLLASGELPMPRGESALPIDLGHLGPLARLVGRLTGRPLSSGNAVTPLIDGDAAYPAMIEAIDQATQSVGLATYIFDNDAAGHSFLAALERAVGRGVQVRVLIDAVGARYSWPLPSMVRELRRRGVRVARYGPTLVPWRWAYFNLRNHRKILVTDGRVGFTGGMNIREGHVLRRKPPHAIQDLQFRLEGPAVADLAEAFIEDWGFTTGEILGGPQWIAPATPGTAGQVTARGIPDGPDEDFEKGEYTLLGAMACARTSVTVVTPYFLPDTALTSAMGVAALRGVRVDIVLPEVNNQRLVRWASRAQLWQVLQRGCRVFETPAPFDHSKLLLVDGIWARFGSSNWDARSLRLNWEYDVECYDRALVASLEAIVAEKLSGARPVTLDDLDRRGIAEKLRDGIARLATPYL